ncbi:MAG: metal-dependent phosphohydrolase [Cyanobacteria bacterium REEB459]|nr:metal-dependent phosphohydrolase [Cyanobacteria bacterium REEB459]
MLDGSILKQLVAGSARPSTTPLNYGVYYKNTLVALCHALEDAILNLEFTAAPLVITAFQRGKWYLQEADRYAAIADRAEQVVIMASPDGGFHDHPTGQRPNVTLVDLADDDPVTQEWHLIILSPDYCAMVLCQELSASDYGAAGVPLHDLERKFYGFWTFDASLVRTTADLAISHLKGYHPQLGAQLHQLLEQQLYASQQGADVNHAVTQVVTYLQDSRHHIRVNSAFNRLEDLDQNLANNEIQAFLCMARLVDRSDARNPLATEEVVSLLDMMAQLIDLPAWQLQRLRLAGWLHRIAPANNATRLASDGLSCPLVPQVQSLRLMPRLRAVATIIAHQQEWWDGGGLPAGLSGDSIPLESRMLALVVEFQQLLAHWQHHHPEEEPETGLIQALEHCQREASKRWDPKLVEILELMVTALQQGMGPPQVSSQISLGSGLLNPDLPAPSLV